MEFQLPINIAKPAAQIHYRQKILLMGSCFSENIGDLLAANKFNALQNPNGILFDPISIYHSLVSYIEKKEYAAGDLFQANELWHSWQHHSMFSGTDRESVLEKINASQHAAASFIADADWLIITLGTAYSYRLTSGANPTPVANCHKVPATSFHKHLLTIEEILTALDNCMHRLFKFNQKLRIIFTVSPVRHIRDGIVENNRSKARLLEAVHHMVNKFDGLYYFPAYELVLDVLRDYRFYEEDMVHPNSQATAYVYEKFGDTFFSDETKDLAEKIKNIVAAKKHRPFHAHTDAHRQFLAQYLTKTKNLQQQFPFLDLQNELRYFAGTTDIL